MKFHALYLFLLLHIFPTTPTAAATPPAYTPSELILLNCGTSTILNDTMHRSWVGDDHSRFWPANAAAISLASTATKLDPSVSPVPYETARVFPYTFTYTFQISKGQKFLRLYFYPGIYSNYDTSQSFFSVLANAFTLLSNFSPSLYSKNSSEPSFMKEFIINIEDSHDKLLLTFFPGPYSFAFINGIEIVSIPDELYFQGKDFPLKYVEENTQLFYLDFNSALEKIYRLNVGGPAVDNEDDSGMFRAWSPDNHYLTGVSSEATGDTNSRRAGKVEVKYTNGTPPYSAPVTVYTTARVTASSSIILNWEFLVDSGFNYLLRFHFCEFTPGVTKSGQRIFTIAINNIAAGVRVDVVSWAGGPLNPTFKDYITLIPDYSGRGKQNLRVSLYPISGDAMLNGLEIFKLNDSMGSLAAASPANSFPPPSPTAMLKPEKKSRGSFSVMYTAMGSVVGVLAVGGVLSFLIYWKVKKPSQSTAVKSSWLPLSNTSRSTTSSGTGASQPSKFCRYFSLAEIKTATSDFDRDSIIGRGGFGYVYKGVIDNGATTVAIKRLNPSSNQGAREFLTEIQMLSQLRHLHLVSLIGYCDDDEEMILVYDYMANGSLRDHLYSSANPPLSWKQRLQICMGAAKGLHYLHVGTQHAIIHRDVKSTNILLDENWEAKISDFGLSKMGDTNDSFTHISTNVKGTFGYLDPKYLSTHQLTRKSDVYAFGVVLFEILSGRPAVDVRLDEEQHSLAGWARYCVREGEVDQLIDPNLVGQISAACLKVYVGIAGRSIHVKPLERPTMADVVMGLELALALQDSAYSAQHEEENAEGISSDRSEVVVSLDDITYLKGEVDMIISQDYPSSSTINHQGEG